MEAGRCGGSIKKEFELKDGERIVGVKSCVRGGVGSATSPCQDDVQFVIGWIDYHKKQEAELLSEAGPAEEEIPD